MSHGGAAGRVLPDGKRTPHTRVTICSSFYIVRAPRPPAMGKAARGWHHRDHAQQSPVIPLITLPASQSLTRGVCPACSAGFRKWGNWKSAQESHECDESDGDQETRGAVQEPGVFHRES